jgi:7-keto-8-aminopelargonate synthetase-like enzyme
MGSARLRLCVTAAHSLGDLEFALDAFRRVRE